MAIRIFGSAALAAAITLVLFWTMTALIARDDVAIGHRSTGSVVHILDVRKDEPPQEKVRQTLIRPPVPDHPRIQPILRVIGPGTRNGRIPDDVHIDPFDSNRHRPTLHKADSDAVPMVRVPPHYPERALARGMEGRVLVEFTITRSGSVRDARVIAAEPPSIFDAAALRAVRQWRYAPRIVDGVAVERPDVRISILFRDGKDERSSLRGARPAA